MSRVSNVIFLLVFKVFTNTEIKGETGNISQEFIGSTFPVFVASFYGANFYDWYCLNDKGKTSKKTIKEKIRNKILASYEVDLIKKIFNEIYLNANKACLLNMNKDQKLFSKALLDKTIENYQSDLFFNVFSTILSIKQKIIPKIDLIYNNLKETSSYIIASLLLVAGLNYKIKEEIKNQIVNPYTKDHSFFVNKPFQGEAISIATTVVIDHFLGECNEEYIIPYLSFFFLKNQDKEGDEVKIAKITRDIETYKYFSEVIKVSKNFKSVLGNLRDILKKFKYVNK